MDVKIDEVEKIQKIGQDKVRKNQRDTSSKRSKSRGANNKQFESVQVEEVDNIQDHYLLSFNKKSHQNESIKVQSLISLADLEPASVQDNKTSTIMQIMDNQ